MINNKHASRSRHFVLGLGTKRDLKTIKLLLERGTDPKASNAGGWTLLHFVAGLNNIKAARLLVKAGADVSAATEFQMATPLHFARSYKMAQLLLDAGADPLALNYDQRTPLSIAILVHRPSVIKLLLQAGGDIMTRQPGIGPCLYWPMRNGDLDKVKKLLYFGANPWQGITIEDMPWHNASQSSRHAAIAYLFETAHNGNAIRENTPQELVRLLISRRRHEFGCPLTEEDLRTVAKLVDAELCTHYPVRSLHEATAPQALCECSSAQGAVQMQFSSGRMTGTDEPPLLNVMWADEENSISRLREVISIFANALFNNSNNKFQGDMQFMKRKRPPCLSMPWTIWPALVVLWGVCWMFIYSPVPEDLSWLDSIGLDGSTSELDTLGFWNEVFDGPLLFPDPTLDAGAQGIRTEEVFPSMLSVGAQPRVSAQASDCTNTAWDLQCAAPQATSHPIPTSNSHQSQLVELAPRAPGLTAGLGAMAGTSSGAVQKQTSWQCDSCSSRFGRRTTLLRHQREQHGPSEAKKYFCPRRGCKHHVDGQGFARKDQLNRHLRRAEYCRSRSASTRLVGDQRQGQQAPPPQDDEEESAASFQGSPPSPASTVQEQSIDPNAYMDRLLRSTLAALTAEEQECEAEEREAMAQFAKRKKRIKNEKRQAQAALDAFNGSTT